MNNSEVKNICQYCKWSKLHTCTDRTCKEAILVAEKVRDKMNRLTYKNTNGTWGLNNNYDMAKVPSELYGALYKLKDYEETGLTPERVEQIDRLYLEKCEEINKLKKELQEKTEELEDTKAKELIFNPGDKVYTIMCLKSDFGEWTRKIYETKVTQIILSMKGMAFYTEITYQDGNKQSYEYTQDEINKSVFLSREDAEQAMKNNDENGLKPCPFCGMKAKIKELPRIACEGKVYYAYCSRCDTQLKCVGSKEAAIKNWNMRIHV